MTTYLDKQLLGRLNDWISEDRGKPLGVFGPRITPRWTMTAAYRIGRLAVECNRELVSGGARGIDHAGEQGALEAGGKVRIFEPVRSRGIPGLFERTRQAIDYLNSFDGSAVLMVPYWQIRQRRGGTRYTAKYCSQIRLKMAFVQIPDSCEGFNLAFTSDNDRGYSFLIS